MCLIHSLKSKKTIHRFVLVVILYIFLLCDIIYVYFIFCFLLYLLYKLYFFFVCFQFSVWVLCRIKYIFFIFIYLKYVMQANIFSWFLWLTDPGPGLTEILVQIGSGWLRGQMYSFFTFLPPSLLPIIQNNFFLSSSSFFL